MGIATLDEAEAGPFFFFRGEPYRFEPGQELYWRTHPEQLNLAAEETVKAIGYHHMGLYGAAIIEFRGRVLDRSEIAERLQELRESLTAMGRFGRLPRYITDPEHGIAIVTHALTAVFPLVLLLT